MFLSDVPQWMECLALFSLGYCTLKFVLFLIDFINTNFCGSCPDFQKFGTWSVITGSTDGIGLAYAQQLARQGQKIVLISRDPEKLKMVAEKLEKDFNAETMTIAADFSDTCNIYNDIKNKLKGLDIGVLVNNVGVGYPYPEYYLDLPNQSNLIDRLISVNVNSVAKMTEIVLPIMALKKKGIILNLSSASADPPTPLLSLYAATKQFVDCFSKCIAYEYKDAGIIVQCVMPYFVATKMSKIRKPNWFAPSPETFVKSSLKTIGKSYRSYGCLSHAIQGAIFSSIPQGLYMSMVFNSMKGIRKRALKRLQSKKE